MSESYVFVGPTLAAKDARAEFDAVCLPPVSAGDIGRLWPRRPRLIGIIDGYFAQRPAVWHKEILWIMERGVHVFGSAGLGALRAAELDAFGMRGVGWVYQAFKDATLDRDDEVAVKLGATEDGYPAQSIALVNIRRTLQAAQHRGIISDATRHVITATAAALFYRDRNWCRLLEAARAAGADSAELSALAGWLPCGHIDQQADDARAMLREMHRFLATSPPPQQVSWTLANTARWVAARQRLESTPEGICQADRPGVADSPAGVGGDVRE